MRIVGNNRADDAAHYQRADPVAAVHAAVVVMVVMMGLRRCGVMLLNDGTAVMDGTAFMRHGLRPVVRAAAMDNGAAVVDRATFMDGTAFVCHGLRLVVRTAFVHNGTAVVDRVTFTDGAAFVRHGLRLVALTALVHGLHSLSLCAFMNGRPCLVAVTLLLHRGFHLMAGGTFLRFPPDLLGLRRGLGAVGTGCCRLGYAHYERSA